MNWQLAIGLITLGISILSAIALYSWRAGAWTGEERRHGEELDRRMEQANGEMSKLASIVQALIPLKTDFRVMETKFDGLEQKIVGSEGIDKRLYDVSRKCESIDPLKHELERLDRQLNTLEKRKS